MTGIICKMGWHDWETFETTRICRKCEKKQALFAVGMEEERGESGRPVFHAGWQDYDWTKDPM